MLDLEKKNFWIVGLIVMVISFCMLLVGVKIVLGNELIVRNIVAFLVFSVVTGIIALLLVYFRLNLSLIFFIAGLTIGFFEMYRAFLSDMSGWGDLIGIMSLFMWSITGLGIGILIQFGRYLYTKFKK
ncbi:MAG: hypothetical protein APF84_09215 [Gracilibacter sp. BRH_c7a]|nr:MAG: hypothetical protein APF84_09215 [Gracilibacter sp. BRH_c7a]